MKRTKKEIVELTRELARNLKWLSEKARKEEEEGGIGLYGSGMATGREIAYKLASKWLEEIVGKDKEGEG